MEFFDAIDHAVTAFVNSFARRSELFDRLMLAPIRSPLVKTAVLILPLWWAWFRETADRQRNRGLVVEAIAASMVAIVIGRVLQHFMPHRPRPLHDPDLQFVVPFSGSKAILGGWSSFPSDHAIYLFALSTSLLFISRRVGWFAIFWTAVIVCFPRIYHGLHYFSDIVAGAAIGICVAIFIHRSRIVTPLSTQVLHFEERWPQLFYPFTFLVTWQMAVLFDNIRSAISFIF